MHQTGLAITIRLDSRPTLTIIDLGTFRCDEAEIASETRASQLLLERMRGKNWDRDTFVVAAMVDALIPALASIVCRATICVPSWQPRHLRLSPAMSKKQVAAFEADFRNQLEFLTMLPQRPWLPLAMGEA